MWSIVLVFLAFLTSCQALTCGYDNCPKSKPGMINIHLIPHTHDDVGWLKTVDQYYYGYKTPLAGVQYILNTVLHELEDDPTKRFIYVESAFFYRWWNQQHDRTRLKVKRLVRNGQLEFILGGWSMNDEATTHYSPIIDQHTLGFQFLRQNFGECGIPKIGWQIDPFGHSREQASLFAQFGFDGLFFGRLDYDDKENREKTKTMEMLWKGSPRNVGSYATLFTGVLPNGYNPPAGFNFGWYGGDPPIMDDERMHDYNVDQRVNDFLNVVKEQRRVYKTDNLVMTMGTDFNYFDANVWYTNMDKLIQHVNERQSKGVNVNVFYSTPSCYLNALHQANQTWSQKSDDFFPYASDPHAFWTGYFSSRPALKRYAFEANGFLQIVKQMDVIAQLELQHGSQFKINALRRSLGVLQHHDAISGTEKQHVANDYAQRLSETLIPATEVYDAAFAKLANKSVVIRPRDGFPMGGFGPETKKPLEETEGPKPLPQRFCPLLNISACNWTSNFDMFTVTAYNPLGWDVLNHLVELPVLAPTGVSFNVIDAKGDYVETQINEITEHTKDIPGRFSAATHLLVFPVMLPPLGFATYFVSKSSTPTSPRAEYVPNPANKAVVVRNEFFQLTFDGTSGKLAQVANLKTGQKHNVQQDLFYYESHAGNNSEFRFRASGAYIFRPVGEEAKRLTEKAELRLHAGKTFTLVHQKFGDWATQTFRLSRFSPHFDVEWTLGPIPIGDGIGKEIVTRFTTDLNSDTLFFTDANGREIQERKRNFRPTWTLNNTEPVAGNYYPVNSRIFIRDTKANSQLTVLTDRSQGGSSLKDGQMELMLHRRCLHDDAFGVGEPLNETGISGKGLVVRGRLSVFLHRPADAARDHRRLAQSLYLPPVLSFSPSPYPYVQYARFFASAYSGLIKALPPNVHLLTLEPWEGRSLLLRLEHFYEIGEDDILSKPASVDLSKMFAHLKIGVATEMTLGANRKLAEAKRLRWRAEDGSETPAQVGGDFDGHGLVIRLKPMQIRTFVMTLA